MSDTLSELQSEYVAALDALRTLVHELGNVSEGGAAQRALVDVQLPAHVHAVRSAGRRIDDAMRAPVSETLWVCVDCAVARVNGDEPTDRPSSEPPLWALLPSADVAPGLLWTEHECERTSWDDGGECECERITFSRWDCDACGSQLAGERHAFTSWSVAR